MSLGIRQKLFGGFGASAEEMTAQIEEMSAQADELSSTAEQLRHLVARFRLAGTDASADRLVPLRRAA